MTICELLTVGMALAQQRRECDADDVQPRISTCLRVMIASGLGGLSINAFIFVLLFPFLDWFAGFRSPISVGHEDPTGDPP